MTGCDPSAVDGRPEWFRNVGESDLQGSGQPGGGLVAELARRAVLLGRVLLVADGGGGRGAGQRQRQREDPSVPAWATSCRPRVHGLSLGHQAVDATRESPKAARTARAKSSRRRWSTWVRNQVEGTQVGPVRAAAPADERRARGSDRRADPPFVAAVLDGRFSATGSQRRLSVVCAVSAPQTPRCTEPGFYSLDVRWSPLQLSAVRVGSDTEYPVRRRCRSGCETSGRRRQSSGP